MDFIQENATNDALFDPYQNQMHIIVSETGVCIESSVKKQHNSTEKDDFVSMEEKKQANKKALDEAFARVQDHD